MRIVRILAAVLLVHTAFAQNAEEQIRAQTRKFTEAIVSKDLSVLDDVFEKDPADIFYDINEGPLTGFDRLKRVWSAATWRRFERRPLARRLAPCTVPPTGRWRCAYGYRWDMPWEAGSKCRRQSFASRLNSKRRHAAALQRGLTR